MKQVSLSKFFFVSIGRILIILQNSNFTKKKRKKKNRDRKKKAKIRKKLMEMLLLYDIWLLIEG